MKAGKFFLILLSTLTHSNCWWQFSQKHLVEFCCFPALRIIAYQICTNRVWDNGEFVSGGSVSWLLVVVMWNQAKIIYLMLVCRSHWLDMIEAPWVIVQQNIHTVFLELSVSPWEDSWAIDLLLMYNSIQDKLPCSNAFNKNRKQPGLVLLKYYWSIVLLKYY